MAKLVCLDQLIKANIMIKASEARIELNSSSAITTPPVFVFVFLLFFVFVFVFVFAMIELTSSPAVASSPRPSASLPSPHYPPYGQKPTQKQK